MKKNILITLFLFILSYSHSHGQQLMERVQSKLHSHLSSYNGDRFNGKLEITDAKEVNGTWIVMGSFEARMSWLLMSDTYARRKFKARVKVIFDDITVVNCCYQYFLNGSWYTKCTVESDIELNPF